MDDLVKKDMLTMSHSKSDGTENAKQLNVYIWDMDETLILLKSLLDGTYAASFNGLKDTRRGIEIGKRWEILILNVCDDYFFYKEIENYNQPFLSSVGEYDDGKDLSNYDFKNDGFSPSLDISDKKKLAYRHRSIAEKYSEGLHKLLGEQMVKQWKDLYSLTDSYTDGWLSAGHTLLKQTLGRAVLHESDADATVLATTSASRQCENVNVIVTSGSLIPSLVKCLLYQLDDTILPENVYSSWDVGKLSCFSRIRDRFKGPNVRFCAIGDGIEEYEASKAMSWPFVKINFRPSSPHRFPGLTTKNLQSYIAKIYGSSSGEVEENKQ